ncbi:MAG TPA: hypothetical protein VGL72_30335 [Bryobacteraceae bacterium]|jgi:hypothetical protein
MKPWLRFAARFYPKLWRARYGTELEALLEESRPAWSDLFDVLRGALTMQARTLSSYVKLIFAVSVAGVVIAVGASFLGPKAYLASSVITPDPSAHASDNPEVSDRLMAAWQQARSRQSLSEIIQRPRLDLYRAERKHKPIEDVIEDMQRDLRFTVSQGTDGPRFHLSFTYPDREKAEEALAALRKRIDQSIAREASLPRFRVTVTPVVQAPLKHPRIVYAWWGLGAGLLVGAALAALRWRPRWTLNVMACGFAGFVLGALLSLLIPRLYISTATARVLLPAGQDGVRHLMKDGQLTAWLQRRTREVLDDAALAEIIDRPAFDLYRKEREQQDMRPAIAAMRRDLRFIVSEHFGFTVSFTYPDRFKAQRVVSDVIAKLADSVRNAGVVYIPGPTRSRSIQGCAFQTGDAYVNCIGALLVPEPAAPIPPARRTDREDIDLLDAASLPETPAAPDRRVLAFWGLVFGLALGSYALTGGRRRELRLVTGTLLR